MQEQIAVSKEVKQIDYFRPKEWTRRTGMPLPTTYEHMYAGRLRAFKVGRAWFIHASEIKDFFERYNENDVA